jgi:ribosomal 50S subunit-recycling heat shock protein
MQWECIETREITIRVLNASQQRTKSPQAALVKQEDASSVDAKFDTIQSIERLL